MVLELLSANLIHGVVGLLWAGGLRRFARPLSASLVASLLVLTLVLPVLLAAARLVGLPVPTGDLRIVRVDLWLQALRGAGPGVTVALVLLLVGTAVIFLVQEVAPAWRRRRTRLSGKHTPAPRLDASLARVLALFDERGIRPPRGPHPRVLQLESDEVVAGLLGLRQPVVLVSRGLLAELDDAELDAVMAHELAHLVFGGNRRLLLVWLVRALQAPSPAALLLFRDLVEATEVACDELAARVTGRPAALASALLRVQGGEPLPTGGSLLRRAGAEIARRADLASAKGRVRRLLEEESPGRLPSPVLRVASALLLGGLLWAIG